MGSNVFGAINILFKTQKASIFSPYESMVFNIAIVSLPTFKIPKTLLNSKIFYKYCRMIRLKIS